MKKYIWIITIIILIFIALSFNEILLKKAYISRESALKPISEKPTLVLQSLLIGESSDTSMAMTSHNAKEINLVGKDLDKALSKMVSGKIVFNAPSSLNIDGKHTIVLILSLSDTIEQLKKAISENGKKYGANIKVSNRMEARLSGTMFQIKAITDEIQAISETQSTIWKWEIYPKKEGLHSLHLTLTAHLEVDGRDTPRTMKTFSKEIKITITATQKIKLFFTNNWQWLWVTILFPLFVWYLKKKKLKK